MSVQHRDIEALHREGISATMIAGVCGLSPWESPYSIYQRIVGAVPANEETPRMRWGKLLEPIVVNLMKDQWPELKIRANAADRPVRRSDLGFPMIAIPDGWAYDDDGREPVEAKTASFWSSEDWSRELPLHYFAQVQWQIAVAGAKRAYCGALPDGEDLRPRIIERDEKVIAAMIERGRAFWCDHVVPRIPPPIDGHRATSDALSAMWPQTRVVSILLPDEAMDWVRDYQAAKDDEDAAKVRKDEAANHLRELLGDAESGVVGDRKVVWKSVTQHRIDAKALRDKRADIAAEFTKETTSRRFEIKEVSA